jgi:signal transduction histidine kinase
VHVPYEAVLDALVDPVLVTDSDATVVHANRAAIARLCAAKYVGLPIAEVNPAQLDHPVRQVLTNGIAVLRHELTVRHEDDTPARYVVDVTPLIDSGRTVGTVAVFRLPGSGTEADAALVDDHAQRLEAVLNLVSDAVFLVADDGRLIFSNTIGQALLGLPLGASLGERHRHLDVRDANGTPVPPARFPSTMALAGHTLTGTLFLIRGAGSQTRHVVTSAHPLRRPDGYVYAALVTMNDVTDEVRSRRELEAARETAEEANHLKDQFIAALSHELRTPLQPILGWTEVLRRHGNLDTITAQALDAIRRNIRHQVRLVDDLLDLSRIVHGKLVLRYETFDLREQIRAAAEPFEEAAALRRVRLTIALPDEAVLMWGDGARVQQIGSNLISNAVKFTPAGGHVSVQLIASEHEALIEVEDTGEGIPPEELAVIFEAFRQGSSSGRRGGLGIGLDLVRRLAQLHGGSVEAYSEGPGYGARFTVRLPRGRPRTSARDLPATEDRRLQGRRILLIEDNIDTREVMRFMLEAEGAEVATAEGGAEGLRRAHAWKPQVVLCDIGLPDIDGLEVARRARRDGSLDDTRLIALTGYGQPEDVQHALDAGFEAHLTKPINLDQLLSLLDD